MSTATAIGALVFMLSLLALVFLAAGIVHVARAWAEDRRREAYYADEWVKAHRAHQHDRHTHEQEGRPE